MLTVFPSIFVNDSQIVVEMFTQSWSGGQSLHCEIKHEKVTNLTLTRQGKYNLTLRKARLG